MSKYDTSWPMLNCLAVQQRYRDVKIWELDYVEGFVNQNDAQDDAPYRHSKTAL